MYISFLMPFLMGSIFICWGRYLGRYYSTILAIVLYLYCFFLFFFSFFEISILGNITEINLFNWLKIGYWLIPMELYFDSLNNIMLLLVFCISSLVMIYSWDYMEGDPYKSRFFSYLGFFTFFMLLLVLSGNLVCLFIGWEGVGLSSYLLISFWYTRVVAVKSAIKAMVVNRIGDVFLLFACVLMLIKFNSLNFLVVKSLIYFIQEYINVFHILFIESSDIFGINFLTILGLSLFIGAMSKSAQLGLHTWLPDAMEGPTPVSALIHAATMVTAGVFLVIRFSFLFEYLDNILIFITIIGVLTCFFAALIGTFQYDIKKIVAYSTCSQLGYMFFACGFSNYSVAFFHLFNHGFFKALLFLSMGSIIHAYNDEQDFRRMGSVLNLLPISYLAVFIGSWALLGIPFFAGFYSKDLLLELTYIQINFLSSFSYTLGVLGAFFTAFYSTRLAIWVFFTKTNSYRSIFFKVHESENLLFGVLVVLLSASIFVGYMFFDSFVNVGSIFFSKAIYLNYYNYLMFDAEFNLTAYIKLLPLILSLGGIYSYLIFFYKRHVIFSFITKNLNSYVEVNRFFSFALLFDNFYNSLFLNFYKYNYNFFFKLIEKNLLEWTGFSFFNFFYTFMNRVFNYVYSYFFFSIMFMVFSIYILLFFYILFVYNINLLIFFLIFIINIFLFL